MRGLVLCASVCVVACGGGTAAPSLGEPADPVALRVSLDAVAAADPARAATLLAGAVRTQCGEACACLRPIAGGAACPAANDAVPPAWPPMELAGRYLAAQVARARGATRDQLIAALDAIRVPIPRVDPARWSLPTAEHDRPLSITTALVGVTASAAPVVASMPVARFDARGARVEDDPGASYRGRDDFAVALAAACGQRAPALAGDASEGAIVIAGQADVPLDGRRPIVAAAADASAYAVVQLVRARGGTLAVRAGSQAHELPIAFREIVDPGDTPSLQLLLGPGQISIEGERGTVSHWPSAGGRYDTAAVRAGLREASPSPHPDVAITLEAGTVADLIRLLDLALDVGAGTVRVTVLPPPSRYATSIRNPTPSTRHLSIPSMRTSTPVVFGDLSGTVVRRYLRRNQAKLQYCYEKQLLLDDTLEGGLTVELIVGADGVVASLDVAGFDPAVADCATSALRSIEFPTGAASTSVSFQLTFHP